MLPKPDHGEFEVGMDYQPCLDDVTRSVQTSMDQGRVLGL